MHGPAEELFDVVDEQDRVVRQAPRSEVHARGLLHRAVHVFVFNSAGELLVQMRSEFKDEFPDCWTSSASGHLGAGETYEQAAPRELAEEVGLAGSLQFVGKFPASRELANEHTVLYSMASNEQPRFDPREVKHVAYHQLDDLMALLAREPQQFSSPFAFLLRWFVENESAPEHE